MQLGRNNLVVIFFPRALSLFASIFLMGSLALAQLPDLSESDLNAPENQIQGKPGEPKTDVPPESLSVGNPDEGAAAQAPSPPTQKTTAQPQAPKKTEAQKTEAASKPETAPPLEEIPPPESTTEATPPAEQPQPKTTVELDATNPDDQNGEASPAPAAKADDSSAEISVNSEAGDEDVDDDGTPHPRNKICNCQYKTTVPYTERRSSTGGYFGLGAGMFLPVNYQPDFNNQTFSAYYDTHSPNIELTMGLKFNFVLGSVAAQVGGSYFKASSSSDGGALTVFPIMVGVNYSMDNLFKEPYVVPYVIVGLYSDIYNESVGGQTVKGNSAFSEFYSVGVLFQLDAIDEDAHNAAYADYGLENTFLYVEARSFLPASNDLPDFSTPLQFSGGLKIEF